MSLGAAVLLLAALPAAGAEDRPRRLPPRTLVEVPSAVGRGGLVGEAAAPEVALTTGVKVQGVPSELDMSVLAAPDAPPAEAPAAEAAPAPAPAPAPAAARPRPAPRPAPKPPGPPLPALLGGLAAAAVFWPFWARLNRQQTESVPFAPRGRPQPTQAPDYLAEAERAGLLAGRYELKTKIGRGGMAQVWEGYDRAAKRPVAVKKVFIPEGPRAESRRRLALQEARTLVTLRHPHVVEFYEVLELPSGLYLVFEFLSGKTLQQVLAERRRLSWAQVKTVVKPVCAALEFAHARGFVHRDLKPSNVMVTPAGLVKVMDFGIARALVEGDQALDLVADAPESPRRPVYGQTSNLVGTPGYRPPEAEKGVVSVAFDVYSLGAVLYECLTGELPPRPGTGSVQAAARRLAQLAADAPPGVVQAVLQALEPELGRRPSSLAFFTGRALDL